MPTISYKKLHYTDNNVLHRYKKKIIMFFFFSLASSYTRIKVTTIAKIHIFYWSHTTYHSDICSLLFRQALPFIEMLHLSLSFLTWWYRQIAILQEISLNYITVNTQIKKCFFLSSHQIKITEIQHQIKITEFQYECLQMELLLFSFIT